MNWPEHRIPPPVVALLIALAMWWLAGFGPWLPAATLPRVLLGCAIALLGGAISSAGSIAFRRARTTVNPMTPDKASALVTRGIYTRTRNPMYVGVTLVLLGWAVYLCALWPLLGPVAFVLYISHFQIAPEERALSKLFGADYAAYCTRVRRWL